MSEDRWSQARTDGWNGKYIDPWNKGPIPFYSADPQQQADYEQGLREGAAVEAHNAAIWACTPKERFGNK